MSFQDFSDEEVRSCFEYHPKMRDEIIAVNHAKLAHMIIQHAPIATLIESGEMIIYAAGKYHPNGKELVQKILVTLLAGYRKTTGQTIYNSSLLKEVLGIIKGLTYQESKKFDSDLHLINCKNGILNWKTMEFRPHARDGSDFSRIQLDVKYDPDATCPTIYKVFKKIIRKGDFRKAMEFIAYCLYREYPIQKAFILLGPGGTGKSHFIDIIRAVLGSENVSSTSMHDLEEDRFATSDLMNKLLNENGDLSQEVLPNVNILKMITSNKDVIRAQKKGEQAFEFINFAKVIFAANKLPRVKDDTTGFYRRIEILPFEHVFTEQERVESADDLKRLLDPSELSGLLNMVLPYLEPLLENGRFDNSFEVATAKDEYRRQSEPVSSFVEMCIKEMADECVAKETIYAEYVRFCKLSHIEPLHPVPFGKALKMFIPWYQHGIRDFGGDRHTCLINTRLIRIDSDKFDRA